MAAVPVIVGVGRVTQRRPAHLEEALDPIGLSAQATRAALADAGLREDAVDSVMFVDMLGELRLPRKAGPAYKDPARSLAERAGLRNARHLTNTALGGNMPQKCVNEAAVRVASGDAEVVVVTGAEAIDTLRRALKAKFRLSETDPTSEADKVLRWGHSPAGGGSASDKLGAKDEKILRLQDLLHNIVEMPNAYALIEQAVRRADSVTERVRREGNARMWAAFSRVAARPENAAHSWFPKERTAEEIAAFSESNRMVAHPYPKLMCAIMDVNQAASVIVTTEARARALGVPADRLVYLHGCGDCNDLSLPLLSKPDLARCWGMRVAGEAAFTSANLRPADMRFFDIYSCFPVAVRLACREMGLDAVLDPERDAERLTVTGGLPFHGGPGNNYVTHSIAAMVETLRANPGAFGLVTANGGVLSKHSVGIYSTTPYAVTHPEHPDRFVRPDTDSRLAALRAAQPLPGVPVNPGDCIGSLAHFTLIHRPRCVVATGPITSGPFQGQRFVAISEEDEVLDAFQQDVDIGADALFGARLRLSTTQLDAKGRAFRTSFRLHDRDHPPANRL